MRARSFSLSQIFTGLSISAKFQNMWTATLKSRIWCYTLHEFRKPFSLQHQQQQKKGSGKPAARKGREKRDKRFIRSVAGTRHLHEQGNER
jgi:hypothetical protein